MTIDRRIFLITASLLALADTAPATAQDTRPADAARADNPLGDIVVTARRREESLQSVPIAITAVSGSQLEQKGINQISDLRNVVPGVNIAGLRRDDSSFFIRGQGPGVLTTGQRNFTSVATYFAEVPATLPSSGSFYDLSSVQILKGPQGTLFGRNTTGGAVLFEPARPTQDLAATIKGTYGNHKYGEIEIMANIPIVTDKIALRVAGVVSRRQGFTQSIYTGQHLDGRKYEAIRGSLLLTPSDNFENLTIVDYRHQDNSGQSEVLYSIDPRPVLSAVPTPGALAPLLGLPAGTSVTIPVRVGGAVSIGCLSAALPGCPTGPFGGAVAAFQAAYHGGSGDASNSGFALIAPTSDLLAALALQQQIGARKNQVVDPLRFKRLDMGVTNKTIFHLNDDITLKNIVAFRKSRTNESFDYDGSPYTFLSQSYADQKWGLGSEQLTEEFQVQGKLPSANIEYILGYYYERTKPGLDESVPGTALGRFSNRIPTNKDTSNAVFGHLEWNPLAFAGISAGVRRTWDSRRAGLSIFDAAGNCTQFDPNATPPVVTCPIEYSGKFSATTYDVTLNLTPARGILVYGGYRRGYKSGGINLPAPAGLQNFGPETVDSFEAGLKADWHIGVPLRTNLSVFYDKYNDIQTQESVILPPPVGPTSVTRNVGRAVNKGFDFETTIVPFRALSLSGFASYLDAASRITLIGLPSIDYPAGAPIVLKGRQTAYQPKWKYGASATLSLPLGDDVGKLALSADYAWQSKMNSSIIAPVDHEFPSYGVLNMRLEWTDAFHRGFDLAIFGTNVTNKTYVLAGYPIAALGFESATYGEPRMYGVSAKFRFGVN